MVLTFRGRATTVPTTARLQMDSVRPPHRFAFRWGHSGGAEAHVGNPLLVEFTLIAEGESTRLRVVESGLADVRWPEETKAT